jgi:hypothetical protein
VEAPDLWMPGRRESTAVKVAAVGREARQGQPPATVVPAAPVARALAGRAWQAGAAREARAVRAARAAGPAQAWPAPGAAPRPAAARLRQGEGQARPAALPPLGGTEPAAHPQAWVGQPDTSQPEALGRVEPDRTVPLQPTRPPAALVERQEADGRMAPAWCSSGSPWRCSSVDADGEARGAFSEENQRLNAGWGFGAEPPCG